MHRQRIAPYIGPGDIEALPGGRDRRGVVVGRTSRHSTLSPLRNSLSAEIVDVFQRHPAGQLHRES